MWANLQEAYDWVMGYVGSLEGVNSITQLAQGAGVVRIPDLLSGDTGDPRDSTNPYTGTFMIYPPLLLPNGDYANIGGMNAGVIQWYGNSSNGKFYTGAGAVMSDANGISISALGAILYFSNGTEVGSLELLNGHGTSLVSITGSAATVPDPGFEVGGSDWTLSGGAAVSTDQAQAGSYSLKLPGGGSATGVSAAFISVSGKSGLLDFWGYGGLTMKAEILCYDAGSVLLGTANTANRLVSANSARWVRVQTLGTYPTGTTQVKIQFKNEHIGGGSFYVDTVSFYSGGGFQLSSVSGAAGINIEGNVTANGAISGTDGVFDGSLTVNDSGADKDVRIEGDTDANLLFTDASTDRVGFGTATPTTKVDVVGVLTTDGADLDGTVTVNDAGAAVNFRVESDTDANNIFSDGTNNRVGVGTATPGYKLDVNGDVNAASGSKFKAGGVDYIASESNTNNIFRCDAPGGTSAWAGTFTAAGSSGSTIKYATTSGTAAAMTPQSTNQLAKMRLYNSTRGNNVLISNHVAGTITSTANYPANWANGDVLTIASNTVTGAPINYVDLELTSGPTSKTYLFIPMIIISATVGDNMRLHPYEAYGSAKQWTAEAAVANRNGVNLAYLKITSNVFSFGWTGTPANVIISEGGYSL